MGKPTGLWVKEGMTLATLKNNKGENMAQTYPYSNTEMTYNLTEHRYILTPEYVLSRTGIDLNTVLNPGFVTQTQQLAQNWLDQLSSEIYTWIYEQNANNVMQEFFLAKVPTLRDYLKNAMIQQVLYVLKNGDLNMYSGVNVKTGQIMDKNLLVQVAVAPNAQRELNRIVPELGIAITYSGYLARPMFKVREEY